MIRAARGLDSLRWRYGTNAGRDAERGGCVAAGPHRKITTGLDRARPGLRRRSAGSARSARLAAIRARLPQNSQWAIADAAARAAGWVRPTVAEYVDGQYAGPKAALRPIYDALAAAITDLGEDVTIEGRSTYIPFVRRRQFAAIAPAPETGSISGCGSPTRRRPARPRHPASPAPGRPPIRSRWAACRDRRRTIAPAENRLRPERLAPAPRQPADPPIQNPTTLPRPRAPRRARARAPSMIMVICWV